MSKSCQIDPQKGDAHADPIPEVCYDLTGNREVLRGVMIGLTRNHESPANRAAYNRIGEAIRFIESAEAYRADDE